MANTYDVGQQVRVSWTYTDASGNYVDPAGVFLNWAYGPDDNSLGATTTWTYPADPIIKDSAGHYHADLDTTAKPGLWRGRPYSAGTYAAAADFEFYVNDSPIK